MLRLSSRLGRGSTVLSLSVPPPANMNASKMLARQPMIRFLGKRTTPAKIDHTPHPHPPTPTQELPACFASYRKKAQQHGPLNAIHRPAVGGLIGGKAGRALGPVEPSDGMYFDRSELPERFQRLAWSQAEIEAIESGGASLCA